MLTIFDTLIDFIFPPRSTQQVVRGLSAEAILPLYRPSLHETVRYLLPYHTQEVSALIQENKFYGNQRAAFVLASALARYLKKQTTGTVLLVPIPLSASRKKTRGYNQVGRILEQLPTMQGITIRTDILSRHKNTPPQTTQNRSERLKNMRNVFTVTAPKNTPVPYTIIIVDDVVTTGSTLTSASISLTAQLPPSTTVLCLAIAH
jgi:ComF family protein